LRELLNVIEASKSNTLAYALTSLQSLMELEYGWEDLDEASIKKVRLC
jgi:engulfment/cell motility protein 1